MVAFLMSVAVTVLAIIPIVIAANRRPVGAPLTWGEALVAGTYVFFLFWWAYAVVPHLWLTYADNELGWRADKIVYGPWNMLRPQSAGGWLPFTLSYQAVRDIIVVLIYAVYLAAPIAGWALWQDRGKRAAAKPAVVTTTFGRPLVKKGV